MRPSGSKFRKKKNSLHTGMKKGYWPDTVNSLKLFHYARKVLLLMHTCYLQHCSSLGWWWPSLLQIAFTCFICSFESSFFNPTNEAINFFIPAFFISNFLSTSLFISEISGLAAYNSDMISISINNSLIIATVVGFVNANFQALLQKSEFWT